MTTPSTHLLTEVRARNGLPSLKVTGEDGQTKALHSLYDPEKEACSLVGGYSYGGEKHIVVLGLGLGYHVLELARRFPDAQLIVVEPSSEIYGMARACGTVDSLSDRATFIVGSSPSEALREITRRQLEAGLNPISIFRFPASFSLFSEFFTPIEAALEKATAVKLWDRLKYSKFTQERVRVLLVDFDYFLTREVERAVVSAGHQVATVPLRKGDTGEVIVSQLMRSILEFRPDFLLTINHLGFDEDGVLTSFIESIELPVASWFVDSPNLIIKSFKGNASSYTTLFLWDKGYMQDMESVGFEAVYYLPLATDEKIFKPLGRRRKTGRAYSCDVGFVGNSMVAPTEERLSKVDPELHPLVERLAEQCLRRRISFDEHMESMDERDRARVGALPPSSRVNLEAAVLWMTTQRYRLQCVEQLSGFDLQIHGDTGWKALLNSKGRLCEPLNYYKELPVYYNRCRINFNATNLQMGSAVNQRVFDVPACGAFLLTDHQEALGEAFEIGKEVIAFDEVEAIPDLVRFYLHNPGTRETIAARGRKRVLQEHTYKHRLNRVIEQMRLRYGSGT
jgi:spore maturation protein CgeB